MADLHALDADSSLVDTGVIDVEPQLVSKPNTTSKVWKYFGLAVEERGKPKSRVIFLCAEFVFQKYLQIGEIQVIFTLTYQRNTQRSTLM